MNFTVKNLVWKTNGETKLKVVLVLIAAVILPGCSQNATPETAKTVNANQNANQNGAQATTNLTNSSIAAAPLNTPTTAVPNNASSAAVNNTLPPVTNTAVPTSNQGKKPSGAANEPKPQNGSGANEIF